MSMSEVLRLQVCAQHALNFWCPYLLGMRNNKMLWTSWKGSDGNLICNAILCLTIM
jgi:hypothetical protein